MTFRPYCSPSTTACGERAILRNSSGAVVDWHPASADRRTPSVTRRRIRNVRVSTLDQNEKLLLEGRILARVYTDKAYRALQRVRALGNLEGLAATKAVDLRPNAKQMRARGADRIRPFIDAPRKDVAGPSWPQGC